MLKSDFANYTGLYGRGNYITRELLMLVEHAEQHPQTAAQLSAKFNADVALVQAALTAAALRTVMSGPGGGQLNVDTVSVSVTPATASIAVAGTQQLTAALTPVNATAPTVWSTSNAAVATVSASGLVTGVSAGSATITATNDGQTDTCVVTVA